MEMRCYVDTTHVDQIYREEIMSDFVQCIR